MSFAHPTAVIFDFDGVIANSEPLHFRCFHDVAASVGIEISHAEYFSQLIGYDDRGAWRKIHALRDRELSDSTLSQLMMRKTATLEILMRGDEFGALPGADKLIKQLHQRGIPLAICSAALRAELEPMLNALELRKYFSIITTADDVEIQKPDPSAYVLTAQRLSQMIARDLPHPHCLVIEDAPLVAQRVRDLGFQVLGITSSAPANRWPAGIETVPDLQSARIL